MKTLKEQINDTIDELIKGNTAFGAKDVADRLPSLDRQVVIQEAERQFKRRFSFNQANRPGGLAGLVYDTVAGLVAEHGDSFRLTMVFDEFPEFDQDRVFEEARKAIMLIAKSLSEEADELERYAADKG